MIATKHKEQLYYILRDPTKVPMFIVIDQSMENLALLEKCKDALECIDELCDSTILHYEKVMLLTEYFKHCVNDLLLLTQDRVQIRKILVYLYTAIGVAKQYTLDQELYETAANLRLFEELLDVDTEKINHKK